MEPARVNPSPRARTSATDPSEPARASCSCSIALLRSTVGGRGSLSSLLLKISLAPALVACASLAGRRFGPRVAGWLIGFPVVAGPVLWFYAREQGQPFAARAAAGTLLGFVSLCVFMVIYGWCALRLGWLASLLVAWTGFLLSTLVIAQMPWLDHTGWLVNMTIAFLALTVTLRALPRVPTPPASHHPRNDLPMRLLATAALVVSLTGLAQMLGPKLSGLFTPFPVATTILVVFAHRQGGAAGVMAVYDGFVPSLYSFAAFCAAVSFALTRWPLPHAYAVALAVSLSTQLVVLKWVAWRQINGSGAESRRPGLPSRRC